MKTTFPGNDSPMTDPFDLYICLNEWLMFIANVGEYRRRYILPYMDPMGIGTVVFALR